MTAPSSGAAAVTASQVVTWPIAWRQVGSAAAVVAVVLTALSGRYGYARDELYFAMLRPAWGYVDQPPLIPLVAHALGSHVMLLRLPASLAAAASVVLVALVTRELGGSGRAQAWSAWGYAGTTAALDFGHVLLTSTLDLVLWPLICLLVIRAELRDRPRLWLVAGAVAGVATYNKLLVAVLLTGIAVGLLVTGRWRRCLAPPVLGAGALALVISLPNLVYQARHDWPQLAMGSALAENNAGEVRWFMWVFMVVVLGPPLVAVWLVGLHQLWIRPSWTPVRFLVPAFVVLVLFTFVSGAQPHYPVFLLVVLFAAGVAALGDRLDRPLWVVLFVVNAVVSAVVALPLLPLSVLGSTPVPAMNLLAADQVGWPTYVRQIREAHRSLPAAERAAAVVVTSNYGEAGAVYRFAPELRVYSGQNALHDEGRPADDVTTVVFVGGQYDDARHLFARCEVVDRLDNGVGVDNEEQGMPVAICHEPLRSWADTWAELRHLD